MTLGGKIVCVAGAAVVVYRACVRPRLTRWGATDEEVAGPYPGADLVPDGERGATMAVTIGVPPDRVWPWLVPLGGDRGGWYSWDHLDNAGRPSADRVHPEWQCSEAWALAGARNPSLSFTGDSPACKVRY
jgi:hypothetical protein